tara:strand:- start:261 stop:1199 length:939 start_codon:yes stop_codon:yes gene_type:complete
MYDPITDTYLSCKYSGCNKIPKGKDSKYCCGFHNPNTYSKKSNKKGIETRLKNGTLYNGIKAMNSPESIIKKVNTKRKNNSYKNMPCNTPESKLKMVQTQRNNGNFKNMAWHESKARINALKTMRKNGTFNNGIRAMHTPESMLKMIQTKKENGVFDKSIKSMNTPEAISKRTKTKKEKGLFKNMPWNTPESNAKALKTMEDNGFISSLELIVRDYITKNYSNIYFETNAPIYGIPDLFFHDLKIIIMVDGCWFHNCEKCGNNHWEGKREKDKKVTDYWINKGYTVIRIWEHEINNDDFSKIDIIFENLKME